MMEDAGDVSESILLRVSVPCVKIALGDATDPLTVRVSRMYPRVYLLLRCARRSSCPNLEILRMD